MQEGIAHLSPELKRLRDQGYIREDTDPPPTRFKATNKAFLE